MNDWATALFILNGQVWCFSKSDLGQDYKTNHVPTNVVALRIVTWNKYNKCVCTKLKQCYKVNRFVLCSSLFMILFILKKILEPLWFAL